MIARGRNREEIEPQNEVAMTGQRRPIPSKFAAIAIFGAFAVSMNGPAHADKRKAAPN